MDDILVHAEDNATHDQRLRIALNILQEAGLTLTVALTVTLKGKCEFSKALLRFLGHIIDSSGIRPDPEKNGGHQQFPSTN